MPEQKSYDYHVYEYVIPAEDWEVRPPRDVCTYAEMAWYPHSERIYVRWRRRQDNPIRPVENAPEGSVMQAHYGTVDVLYETTFYARGIIERRFPKPYTYVSVSLTWGTSGRPSMDDPLGEAPEYETIAIRRTVYGGCADQHPQSTP